MPQVTGRGCSLTVGMRDRSLMGRYLRNKERERERRKEVCFTGTVQLLQQNNVIGSQLIIHWYCGCYYVHSVSVLGYYGYACSNLSF